MAGRLQESPDENSVAPEILDSPVGPDRVGLMTVRAPLCLTLNLQPQPWKNSVPPASKR